MPEFTDNLRTTKVLLTKFDRFKSIFNEENKNSDHTAPLKLGEVHV